MKRRDFLKIVPPAIVGATLLPIAVKQLSDNNKSDLAKQIADLSDEIDRNTTRGKGNWVSHPGFIQAHENPQRPYAVDGTIWKDTKKSKTYVCANGQWKLLA